MPAALRLLSSTRHVQHLRLTGVYFDLTDRFKPASAGKHRQPEAEPPGSTSGAVRSKVLISVAKRLVPSAVQRNTVKRIVRESWRTAVRNAVSMKAQGEHSPAPACLVRLKRYPTTSPTSANPDAKARPQASPAARGRFGTARSRRSLRADIDSLFAALLSGAAGGPRGFAADARRPGRRPTAPVGHRHASGPESR